MKLKKKPSNFQILNASSLTRGKQMVSVILTKNIKDIASEVLDENKKIKLLPSQVWKSFDWNDFRIFCHNYARYGIHTTEQQLCLHRLIDGRETIEIGSGAGDLGYHMRILMTDSKQQDNPDIKLMYDAM